jgi:hypothetical protein
LLEDSQEYIVRAGTAEERFALVAAGSNEMQIATAMNASQASGHGTALYKPHVI